MLVVVAEPRGRTTFAGPQPHMPLNLRYDLRFRSDRTLAARLDAAWQQIDRMGETAVKPSWWDAFHANRMRRSFIRHRSIYRLKARLWVAWNHAAALLEAGSPEGALVLLPFYVLLRLSIDKRKGRWTPTRWRRSAR